MSNTADSTFNLFNRTRENVEQQRRFRSLRDENNQMYIEGKDYRLYQDGPSNPDMIRTQAFNGVVAENSLNQVFMSKANQQLLQHKIRHRVWKESGKKFLISKQSDTDLQIMMRSIYLQYGKNLPYNIQGQVSQLNDYVIMDAVPKILSNVQQYHHYLKDASALPVPLSHPSSMNSAGRKTLPSVTSVFF